MTDEYGRLRNRLGLSSAALILLVCVMPKFKPPAEWGFLLDERGPLALPYLAAALVVYLCCRLTNERFHAHFQRRNTTPSRVDYAASISLAAAALGIAHVRHTAYEQFVLRPSWAAASSQPVASLFGPLYEQHLQLGPWAPATPSMLHFLVPVMGSAAAAMVVGFIMWVLRLPPTRDWALRGVSRVWAPTGWVAERTVSWVQPLLSLSLGAVGAFIVLCVGERILGNAGWELLPVGVAAGGVLATLLSWQPWWFRQMVVDDGQLKARVAMARWRLFYLANQTDRTKTMLFSHKGGEITEGKNDNETKWSVRNGALELMDSKDRVHSRFVFLKRTLMFVHTNDLFTHSLRRQFLLIEEDLTLKSVLEVPGRTYPASVARSTPG